MVSDCVYGRSVDTCACLVFAAPPLNAQPVVQSTAPGEPTTGNLISGLSPVPGTTTRVSGFTVPGSGTSPILPGGLPVAVIDPATGNVAGMLTVQTDGTYSFTPSPGFAGTVPPISIMLTRSDGVAQEVSLSLTVNPPLADANEFVTVPQGGGPVRLNVLDPVLGATVTSFTLPGSSIVYPAGGPPVTDPITNQAAGTVVVMANGTIIFAPAPGFTGQAPPITYTLQSSDGQVDVGSATVVVTPGRQSVVTSGRRVCIEVVHYIYGCTCC